jgi:UbiD family decarboxylase
MSFRIYLDKLRDSDKLIQVDTPVSHRLEAAGILHALEPDPVQFRSIKESSFKVAGNLFTTKASIADYFGLSSKEIIPFLMKSINQPESPQITTAAPCQQVVITKPDLNSLPILLHTDKDGGRYISSGVVITAHPDYGQNLDFHRCMQISQNQLAVRIVKNRHFDQYLKDLKKLEVAVCVGLSPNILLAAATSVDIGMDELAIANAMQPFKVVRGKTVNLWIPADCEFVLEGTIDLDKVHTEGPFVDLTGTYDIIRTQPVLDVHTITHKDNAIWHALLPGGLEHKLLMGMPREPTIFQKVNEVTTCLDVNITPGGSSWLHAVIQIDKKSEEDAEAAIRAAFAGHRSCKHVFVVDKDIDIYDPNQVEWAMATRFQGDKDMIVLPPEQGSSLDPSADPDTHFTTKIGFDLTRPLQSTAENYLAVKFPEIDPARFRIKKNNL